MGFLKYQFLHKSVICDFNVLDDNNCLSNKLSSYVFFVSQRQVDLTFWHLMTK